MNRSYYWLITALSIPAFLWLIPTLWMVSLSFQPNDVLARTTSTTALRPDPDPVHRRQLRSALQPSARRRCGS
jgi:multiple sugar transport system permease protein